MQLVTQEEARITLEITGRVDAQSAPELRSRLDQLLSDDASILVVDLSDVDFIDSAGLAALVKAMKDARSKGGDVELVRPKTAEAYRVFELTRFDRVFKIHPTRSR